MFGNFNIYYNDSLLAGEKVHKESQFNRLMQALVHAGPNGVPKDELEVLVIGEREMEEEHTALRVIVYKSKKKLVKMGLPDIDLIYQKKGVYYLTDEIEIEEDAALMTSYFEQAEDLTDSDDPEDLEKRKLLYLDASYLYKGEFLAQYGAETWVAKEAKRYRDLFKICVDRAYEILVALKDWDSLETLGRFASNVEPFCNWEVLVMNALIEKRMFDQATQYYSDVVDSYLKECGIYPSNQLMDIMDSLGDQMSRSIETLDNIQNSLNEERPDVDGGYCCGFPVFKGIYQMSLRSMERTGQTAYLILCTLVDKKGNEIVNDSRLEELSDRLSKAIRISIRHGDVFTRYGKSQYLILLSNTSLENCELVQNRINHTFVIGRNTSSIRYHVNSVICEM